MRQSVSIVIGLFHLGVIRLQTVVALLTFSLVGSQAVHAGSVRLYVLVPQPPASLSSVEWDGVYIPWFQREFRIPYEIIEPFIRDQIKQQADKYIADTVESPTIFCPDVDWSVTTKSNFEFTQKGQPVITAFGNPQQNGVNIGLDAQVRFDLNVHATADTSLTTEQKGDFPITLWIGIHASQKLNLWPVLQAEPFVWRMRTGISITITRSVRGRLELPITVRLKPCATEVSLH